MSEPRRDPSSNLHGASNSRQPTADEDQTWLEFLRTAGGTVPNTNINAPNNAPPAHRTSSNSSNSSIDRKRRHTSTETADHRRPYPFEPSSTINETHPMSQHQAGSNNAGFPYPGGRSAGEIAMITAARRDRHGNPEFIVGSPPGARESGRLVGMPQRAPSFPMRRESNDTPRWQPDEEAQECTVCETPFGMFNRRHHCRKCGRVVCKPCSPHRITIPKPFIVRAPNTYDENDMDGGEEVRVCKPCVPDPWVPPPPPPASTRPPSNSPQNRADQARVRGFEGTAGDMQRRTPTESAPPVSGSPHGGNVHATGRYRSQSHTQHGFRPTTNTPMAGSVPNRGSSLSQQIHRHRLSQGAVAPFIPSLAPTGYRAIPQPTGPPTAPRPQRPQIREEDECPVCHRELPGGENLRESHIMECINNATLGTPGTATPPHPGGTTMPVPIVEGGTSGVITPLTEDNTHAGASSTRRMLVFKATEKDCADSDGKPQECPICLEDYEVGTDMARLECWCKFHRVCIREWWMTKGRGSCPTHQLRE